MDAGAGVAGGCRLDGAGARVEVDDVVEELLPE
jgi:hypothetical protein